MPSYSLGVVLSDGWTAETHVGSDSGRNVYDEDGIMFKGPKGSPYTNWRFLFTIGGDSKLGFGASRNSGTSWTTKRFE